MQTEQDQIDEEARDEHNQKVETDLKIAFSKVSKEELEELETILKQVEAKHPDVEKNLTRKPVGFMQSCCFVFVGILSTYK